MRVLGDEQRCPVAGELGPAGPVVVRPGIGGAQRGQLIWLHASGRVGQESPGRDPWLDLGHERRDGIGPGLGASVDPRRCPAGPLLEDRELVGLRPGQPRGPVDQDLRRAAHDPERGGRVLEVEHHEGVDRRQLLDEQRPRLPVSIGAF